MSPTGRDLVYENAEAKAEVQKVKADLSKFVAVSRKDHPEDVEVAIRTPWLKISLRVITKSKQRCWSGLPLPNCANWVRALHRLLLRSYCKGTSLIRNLFPF